MLVFLNVDAIFSQFRVALFGISLFSLVNVRYQANVITYFKTLLKFCALGL